MAKKKSTTRRAKRVEVRKKSAAEEVAGVETNWFKIVMIIFFMAVFVAVFYFITIIVVGRGDTEEKKEESIIQYEEILAGSSFSMRPSEYVVIYYDFDDEELSSLKNDITNFKYGKDSSNTVYTVNMGSGFNKKYANEESNKNPEKVGDLAINGPTIIKFVDGKVSDYVEGLEKVQEYLK